MSTSTSDSHALAAFIALLVFLVGLIVLSYNIHSADNIKTNVQIVSADMVSLNVRIRFSERISDVELLYVNEIVRNASVAFMSTERDVMAHQISLKLTQLNIQVANISIGFSPSGATGVDMEVLTYDHY